MAATGLATAVWWQDRPLRQAAAYLEEGDPEKALSTIDAFLRDHPSDGKAMSLRACTLVAVGRPAQAIDLFERFGGSSPKELHAWAQALLQLERWHAALPILEHLATTGVDRAVAVLLQQSSMKLGEVAEAEQWRDKADKLVAVERFREMALRVLQDAPDSNLALVVRAYQFAESGNWVDAESILRTITASEANQQFIDELLRAVERRSSLPSLELLPLIPGGNSEHRHQISRPSIPRAS